MNQIKWCFLVALSFVLSATAHAQVGRNVLPNGGFEAFGATPSTAPAELFEQGADETAASPQPGDDSADENPTAKPQFWYVNATLNATRTTDAHSGRYALKVYPNGASLFSRDSEFYPEHLHVKGGATYTLSYWYKGENAKPNVEATLTWMKGAQRISQDVRNTAKDLASNISATWQKKTITFVAPPQATRAGLSLFVRYDNDAQAVRGHILIDDVRLVMIADAPSDNALQPPTQLRAQSQQREVHLSWWPVQQADARYEVRVNGEVKATVHVPNYVVEDLMPDTRYNISVTTLLGDERSVESAQVSATTQRLERAIDDENRIPQLYTLRDDGTCPRVLRLYWRDLADPNAAITYEIDGEVAQPDGKFLIFPTKGEHTLRIRVEESGERLWTLEYFLVVD